ncbi:MAG: MATE family efflux transporter [Lachnospiraceae bacterium]|nr:MATE family efflux transporter [Lachnospiraceae bacterium]
MAKLQTKEERDLLFSSAPVGKALMTMAIPTIVSQLINLIYNMADTFFVGRTGNPYMIAAVSVSFTLFLFNIPLSGLFGVGGGSYIARLLGKQQYDKISHICAFSIYGSLALTLVYSLAVFLTLEPLLYLLGASSETIGFAKQYVMVVVIIGNIPTVVSATMSHMLRNAGYSKQAGFGLSGGGILNILLDPLFMFVLMPDGYQVLGAAIATCLANTATLIYFILVIQRTKDETGLSLDIRNVKVDKEDAVEIFKVGIPSAITTLLMDFSNMFLNASMAAHGDLQMAAYGIVGKIERLSNAICLGISIGSLPLIAFNFSAGNFKRMKAIIKAAIFSSLCVGLCSIGIYQLFAAPLVHFFISSKGNAQEVALTVSYGISFLRLRCLNAPFTGLNFAANNTFQATGDGKLSLIQAFIRQMLLYVPLIFILDKLWGETGLMLSYPVTEVVSCLVALLLLINKLKKLSAGKTAVTT